MSASVLVVDDDSAVAGVISAVLKDLNMKAVISTNGVDALCRFMSEGPETFSAAIIDLNMPQMNGVDMVNQIRQHNPSIVTILCTGYPDMLGTEKIADIGFNTMISKPFTVTDFKAQFLRALMDA